MQPLEIHEMMSEDKVDGNIAALSALFPEIMVEGKVDLEVLKTLLGQENLEESNEKFGLSWHGKRQARAFALQPSKGTLLPAIDESVDWDTTQNMIIEGDNVEVLKLLQKSYKGQVKMIYIDPPYNTGGDFVYPDNYTDNLKNYLERTGQESKNAPNAETSGRYHTDWLNMIYPRLKLARELLRDDGVIFISIDDNEVANLKAVCNEIFGEENFVANIIWQKKYAATNDSKQFSAVHDHILIYAKFSFSWRPNLLQRGEDLNAKYSNPDNDPRGDWYPTNLSVKTYSESNDYEIISPAGNIFRPPPSRCWVVSQSKYNELLEDNRISFGKNGDSRPYKKTFLTEVQQGIVPTTLWEHELAGHTIGAKSEIRDIFVDAPFDTPKPTKLIKHILTLATTNDNDLILDFFAGSGTTAHAVIAQNAADNGNRRYILVQLPEPLDPNDKSQKTASDFCDKITKPRTIAELTKERVRRAAAKIKEENPMFAGDTGFRVYKLATSNFKQWEATRENLPEQMTMQLDSVKNLRGDFALFTEYLLKRGLDLCSPLQTDTINGKTVYSYGQGTLIACLSNISSSEAANLGHELAKLKNALSPETKTTFLFKDGGFENDMAKFNLQETLTQRIDKKYIDAMRSL